MCPECRGIWFDADEMPDYLRRLLEANEHIPHAELTLDEKAVATNSVEEELRSCPRCAGGMFKHNYAYDSNVILDACPGCGGHWADGGEVLRLAVYTKGHPKLDKLAGSMAAHVEERERFRHIASDVAGLGGHLRPWLLFLPRIILPLYDDVPSAIVPWVTIGLIALNTVVMLFLYLGGDLASEFFYSFVLIPETLQSGAGGYYGLVSYMFLHCGVVHLLGNLLFLWIFGDNIEEEFGHGAFFGFYVLSGVVAAVLHTLLTQSPEAPLVGASGAVAGVMGAYFVFHPQARIRTFILVGFYDVYAVIYIFLWFLVQVLPRSFVSYSAIGDVAPIFSNGAHIGGFITGVLLALVFRLVSR